MILEDLKKISNSHGVDNVIAQFIFSNPDCILVNDAKTIALLTFTSSASVVRFCKHLGFKGYPDFKFKYIEEYSQSKHLNANQLTSNSSLSDIFQILPFRYEMVTQSTIKRLNQMDLAKVIYLFKQADTIDFYATGINYGIVQAACVRYSNIGYHTQVQIGLNQHYIRKISSERKEKVLSIMVSHTGTNQSIIETAKFINKFDQPMIYMGRPNSVLYDLCEYHIPWDNDHFDKEFDDLSYPFSLMCILDIIYIQLSNTK